MAGSYEEWKDYKKDMFMYYVIDRALHDFGLDWGQSIYIITNY